MATEKEELAKEQAEQNYQVEMWKVRKLIKSLQSARGYVRLTSYFNFFSCFSFSLSFIINSYDCFCMIICDVLCL